MANSPAGTATRATVDPAAFRSLMTAHPVGVTIVTTVGPDAEPWGMTCSSLCGVSLQPATLLVCLRDRSPTLAALQHSSAFAVNLLHDRAEPVARLFSSGAPDRFEKAAWVPDPESGVPHLIEDAHTIADCEVRETLAVGDHVVVFGRVHRVASHATRPAGPLLYGMRRYWSLPDPADDGSGR
ncbi:MULTISPECIES: flavin reductase family protein [unclassified Streptomyces]|uniref:flavin reductase family protein n=1 Tax=unclassified Streptomyces TaxID=2593676 RepID=UPI002E762FCD|nr:MULTISPECIES: flavin reductase family protein [unclassified Streptomyces]MEE1760791.1 flavin reductase family protein [Streptomyces sp. SP18BB07]MEE1835718.1 flavin reductase family protein [Streptomyces sp. SP17KL33]